MSVFTKQAIMQAFLRLLDQYPINKITVKNIVDECGVNRNTFYYHFADVPDLVEAIVKDETDRSIKNATNIHSMEECLNTVMEFSRAHRRAVLHVYNSSNRELFEHYLMNLCEYVVEQYLHAAFGELPVSPLDREIIIRTYQCECFGNVIYSLEHNLSIEEEKKRIHRMCELRKGTVEMMISRCSQ